MEGNRADDVLTGRPVGHGCHCTASAHPRSVERLSAGGAPLPRHGQEDAGGLLQETRLAASNSRVSVQTS